jgi:hypothetical protein
MRIGHLWGKTEGKGPLGRQIRRRVDNINTHLREIGCGSYDLTQDRDRWRPLFALVVFHMILRVNRDWNIFLNTTK